MHADAVDEIPLDRPVGKLDERSVAEAGADIRIQRRLAFV